MGNSGVLRTVSNRRASSARAASTSQVEPSSGPKSRSVIVRIARLACLVLKDEANLLWRPPVGQLAQVLVEAIAQLSWAGRGLAWEQPLEELRPAEPADVKPSEDLVYG